MECILPMVRSPLLFRYNRHSARLHRKQRKEGLQPDGTEFSEIWVNKVKQALAKTALL